MPRSARAAVSTIGYRRRAQIWHAHHRCCLLVRLSSHHRRGCEREASCQGHVVIHVQECGPRQVEAAPQRHGRSDLCTSPAHRAPSASEGAAGGGGRACRGLQARPRECCTAAGCCVAVKGGPGGGPRAVLKFHLCVRRSGVLGVEMKTLPVKHYAHNLRTPKHGSRYRYGRRRGRHTTCYYTGRESAAVLGGEAQPPPLE